MEVNVIISYKLYLGNDNNFDSKRYIKYTM